MTWIVDYLVQCAILFIQQVGMGTKLSGCAHTSNVWCTRELVVAGITYVCVPLCRVGLGSSIICHRCSAYKEALSENRRRSTDQPGRQ